MLGEVASRRPLWPAAFLAAGLSCGANPSPASTVPLILLPAADAAEVAAPIASVAASARPAPPRPGAIAWMASERDARELAQRRGAPLLVYVRADWATACLEMERGAWADARVAGEARRFVALRLDVTEAEGNAELYAQRYGVKGVPEVVVLDPSGRAAARRSGAMAAKELADFLHDADEAAP